jgi:hypothetical protein
VRYRTLVKSAPGGGGNLEGAVFSHSRQLGRALICNSEGSWLNFTTGELVEDAIEARAEASKLQS